MADRYVRIAPLSEHTAKLICASLGLTEREDMLILTRTLGESVCIDLMEDIDPRTPVAEVFGRGPIEVVITSVRGSEVKLGISADPALRILRAELWVKRLRRISGAHD